MGASSLTQSIVGRFGLMREIIVHLWLLTKDDVATFVFPNTVFGMCAALAGQTLIEHTRTTIGISVHLPLVLLFNWSNLLIIDLANQRLPISAKEDAINKPWRPIPSGRLTSCNMRHAMLILIPTTAALNYFIFHVGHECTMLFTLTWLYNDLGGGDENWVLRNAIIAAAFGLYNSGSLKTAAGLGTDPTATPTQAGWQWITILSRIIFTTMHVQDLKDQEGDRARARRTAPIVIGNVAARQSIAAPVMIWSCFCLWYRELRWSGSVIVGIGAIVSWRCLNLAGREADRRTWELWASWTALLYTCPLW